VKDPSGNVLGTVNYGYDAANRLTSVNGQVYGYDQNGNLLDDGNKTYTWDADGRLTEVRKKADNSLIAQYEYDADGRRVKSVVNGVVTNFHYDGASIRVLYETDGAGALTTLYTYSDDGLLFSMTKVGQGTYYYHYNAHGDVVQLTDQNGNVAAGYTYDAWGNILSSTGTMAESNPYRYAKYRYDSETGLYYLINRYYNPDIGRFISKEPYEVSSGDLPTINAYTYTQNNPVNAIDPDGNFLWFVAVGAYYAWSVYDSYRDVQTLRSTSASREDRAWAAIGLIGSVIPGGKSVKLVKKVPFKKALIKKGTIKLVPRVLIKRYSASQLKKIGAQANQKDIRAIKGNAQTAWNFFKAQVDNYSERGNGVFVGTRGGITFTYRASSKSGPPTIDVKGITGLRKIKFL
jgi:RHS repeat-associated protein